MHIRKDGTDKENCQKNAKPFEYAFLLDALKDEQSQGITIDTARCFFKSEKVKSNRFSVVINILSSL